VPILDGGRALVLAGAVLMTGKHDVGAFLEVRLELTVALDRKPLERVVDERDRYVGRRFATDRRGYREREGLLRCVERLVPRAVVAVELNGPTADDERPHVERIDVQASITSSSRAWVGALSIC
jgi:hypothetical protein